MSFEEALKTNFTGTLHKLSFRFARRTRQSARVRKRLYETLGYAAKIIVYTRKHPDALRKLMQMPIIRKLRKQTGAGNVSRSVLIVLHQADDRIARERATRHANAIDNLLNDGCAAEEVAAKFAEEHGIAAVGGRGATEGGGKPPAFKTREKEGLSTSDLPRRETRHGIGQLTGFDQVGAPSAGSLNPAGQTTKLRSRTLSEQTVPSPARGKCYAYVEVDESTLRQLRRPGKHVIACTSTSAKNGWTRIVGKKLLPDD